MTSIGGALPQAVLVGMRGAIAAVEGALGPTESALAVSPCADGSAIRPRNWRVVVVTESRLLIGGGDSGVQTIQLESINAADCRAGGFGGSETLVLTLADGRRLKLGWSAGDSQLRAIANAIRDSHTRAAPSRAAPSPSQSQPEAVIGSGVRTVQASVARLQELAMQQAPAHVNQIITAFVLQRGWDGGTLQGIRSGSRAAAGRVACHLGYASRRLEEELTDSVGKGSAALQDMIRERWRDPTAGANIAVATVAMEFADNVDVESNEARELSALPGLASTERGVLAGTALSGAVQFPDVDERSADPVAMLQGWTGGFVIRYAECSLPDVAGGNYHFGSMKPAVEVA